MRSIGKAIISNRSQSLWLGGAKRLGVRQLAAAFPKRKQACALQTKLPGRPLVVDAAANGYPCPRIRALTTFFAPPML
jgi:hypothetical protein